MEMNSSLLQSNFASGENKHQIKQKPIGEPKTQAEFQARRSADEFEAIFISQLLKSMSVGIKSDGPFGGGHSEEIYRDLLNEQMGESVDRKSVV